MDTENRSEVKTIAIVGPECTGKSDLARFLAQYYQTVWVPEFARSYIDTLNRPYEKQDLVAIAKGQIKAEEELIVKANRLLFCDTNLLVIKIWSEFKYGECDPEILKGIRSRKYDLHLLTSVDVPWVEDPQREHPDKREFLYGLYKTDLIKSNVNFVEIRGLGELRRKTAVHAIAKMLKEPRSHVSKS